MTPDPAMLAADEVLMQVAEQRVRAQIAVRADDEYLALLRACERLAALRRSAAVLGTGPRRGAIREFVLACRVATFDRTLVAEPPPAADALALPPAHPASVPGEGAAEFHALSDELRALHILLLQRAGWMEDWDARLNAIEYRRAADHILRAAAALEAGPAF